MSNDNVVSLAAPGEVSDPLTDLLRAGARQLIEAAVSAEFGEYLSAFEEEKLPDGRRRMVRNGHLPERQILTGIGAVDVRVPKARSRSGSAEPFRSALVPPYVRRSASVDAAVPWLYLHGVSTGQMRAAVSALVGEEAARGLSANVVSRLKRVWDEEYREWCRRDLADDWVYVWADGIHSGLRGDDGRLCVLVVIGVNARGDKHFLAIEDGVRESTQSWREVLLGMQQRVFRDNQDENACCLIQECSPVWVALPHQNAPHRILDQPLPDAFRSPSPMLESSTVHGVSSRSVMTGSPLPVVTNLHVAGLGVSPEGP